jgi:hypothetical protein
MEELLERILEELKVQTSLLRRITEGVSESGQQSEEARIALRRAADVFKGTPFGPAMEQIMKGGR